jgi:hypothetical protein
MVGQSIGGGPFAAAVGHRPGLTRGGCSLVDAIGHFTE